jgi:hypothetical protein
MKRLLAFFGLTYALTWACFITVALHTMTELPRQSLVLLGAFAPAIIAVALNAICGGSSGVCALLRPVLRWRVSIVWYLFALFFMAALKLVSDAGFTSVEVFENHDKGWIAALGVRSAEPALH